MGTCKVELSRLIKITGVEKKGLGKFRGNIAADSCLIATYTKKSKTHHFSIWKVEGQSLMNFKFV